MYSTSLQAGSLDRQRTACRLKEVDRPGGFTLPKVCSCVSTGPTRKARFSISNGNGFSKQRTTTSKRQHADERGFQSVSESHARDGCSPSRLRVGIAGGSIAGMVAARALLDSGVDVEVFETNERHRHTNTPGCLMLQNNALRVLELLSTDSESSASGHDLGQEMHQAGSRISSGAFFTDKGEFLWQTVKEQRPVGQDDIGVCVTRDTLYHELESALPSDIVRWGVGVETWVDHPDGRVEITLTDGQKTTCDVLVGADGVSSSTRARLQGLAELPSPNVTSCHCWRAMIDPQKLNGGMDWFLEQTKGYQWVEYWGSNTHFGMFAVGGGLWSWYAVVRDESSGQQGGGRKGRADSTHWNNAKGPQQMTLLHKAFEGFDSPVPEILEATADGNIFYSPLVDRRPIPGRKWGEGAVTLMGDAAHTVLPVMGQGGCLAIEDAFELANELRQISTIAEYDKLSKARLVRALRKYERQRAGRTDLVFWQSRLLFHLGISTFPPVVALRNMMFRLSPTFLVHITFSWIFDYTPAWFKLPDHKK
uniref:FAD-binding domain-containing protein n=1 Tax=Pyramimonas obovata TaxID=1411642 RepID=A0A7S0RCR7_9CHLO|mmetsp:Transcript_30615/g.66811  ORF Transcript_30615/g.66811 Transcript_30615/m.66811 type:complete len:536 (+) Transcript_30615:257-1864(+)|eukprot:CAMPEP_0118921788 /NCGR_PEP_ID=MMETSP1169-20130426/954_1 /TAXON_ID=36882 /ORGANISM="Pyramimonas obovata, Strain CCMP722" /LENGTH=535 /DNA_ID=CAMNT_0006862569 /DNA_START=190 /DNA_END=1797 /DNA_ORIENTATION=+